MEKSPREKRLSAISVLLVLAAAIGAEIMYCVMTVKHNRAVAALKAQHRNVMPRWFPATGYPMKGTSYRFYSLDHGKHWYATTAENEFVFILGSAEEVHPVLARMCSPIYVARAETESTNVPKLAARKVPKDPTL